MKKVVLCIFIIIIVVFVFFLFNKKEIKEEIPTYESDIMCTKDEIEEIDGEYITYKNNIYITLNNNYVSKVVFQSVKDIDLNQNYDISFIQALIRLYDSVDGVTGEVLTTDSYLITTFKYDFELIDLKFLRSELGDLLDSESLFMKVSDLPISFDQYKRYELEGYNCYE